MGNAAGAALKDYNLGGIGNTIAGAIGGVGGGQLLQAAIPAIAAAAGGNLDVRAIRWSNCRRWCRWRDPHGHRRAGEEHDGEPADAVNTCEWRIADQRS